MQDLREIAQDLRDGQRRIEDKIDKLLQREDPRVAALVRFINEQQAARPAFDPDCWDYTPDGGVPEPVAMEEESERAKARTTNVCVVTSAAIAAAAPIFLRHSVPPEPWPRPPDRNARNIP